MARASAQIDLRAYREKHPQLAAQMDQQDIPKRGKAKSSGGGKAGEKAEQALYAGLNLLKIVHTPQYPWGAFLEPPRRFQSDAAILSARLLIEIDGAVHGISDKRERDLLRQNLGTHAGWRFLRYTPEQAISGDASLDIQKYLESR